MVLANTIRFFIPPPNSPNFISGKNLQNFLSGYTSPLFFYCPRPPPPSGYLVIGRTGLATVIGPHVVRPIILDEGCLLLWGIVGKCVTDKKELLATHPVRSDK